MANKKLIKYIKTELKQGYTAQQLKIFLSQKGYTPEEFDKAIAEIQKETLKEGKKKVKSKQGGRKGKKEHEKPPIILIIVTLIAVSGLLVSAFIFYEPLQKYIVYENNNGEGENGTSNEIDSPLSGGSMCAEEIVDCGSSEVVNDCFIAEARNCCPAKLISEFEEESEGIISYIQIQREIVGIDEEKCYIGKNIIDYKQNITESFYQEILDEGTSKEEINEELTSKNKELEEKFIGQEILCDYQDNELVAVLENEKDGIIPPTIKSYESIICPMGESQMIEKGLSGQCLSIGDYFCAEECPTGYNSILSGETCCLNPEHNFCTQ